MPKIIVDKKWWMIQYYQYGEREFDMVQAESARAAVDLWVKENGRPYSQEVEVYGPLDSKCGEYIEV